MKYRKRPIVIKAVQITDATFDDPHPNPLHIAGVLYDPQSRSATIQTLEGLMTAQIGDWIIQGIKGELYPCKPDIFAATYDPAATEASAAPTVYDCRVETRWNSICNRGTQGCGLSHEEKQP